MLSIDEPAEAAKCEDLVKVTIGDDPEMFFSNRILAASTRERSADRVP